jgi:hypothetical protein
MWQTNLQWLVCGVLEVGQRKPHLKHLPEPVLAVSLPVVWPALQ